MAESLHMALTPIHRVDADGVLRLPAFSSAQLWKEFQ